MLTVNANPDSSNLVTGRLFKFDLILYMNFILLFPSKVIHLIEHIFLPQILFLKVW